MCWHNGGRLRYHLGRLTTITAMWWPALRAFPTPLMSFGSVRIWQRQTSKLLRRRLLLRLLGVSSRVRAASGQHDSPVPGHRVFEVGAVARAEGASRFNPLCAWLGRLAASLVPTQREGRLLVTAGRRSVLRLPDGFLRFRTLHSQRLRSVAGRLCYHGSRGLTRPRDQAGQMSVAMVYQTPSGSVRRVSTPLTRLPARPPTAHQVAAKFNSIGCTPSARKENST